TGDAVFHWIEDEDEREKLPIVGYAGYFRLSNGAEKTIYMSVKQIQNHEQKNRKGSSMGKGWREDFDAMARKTVIRRLCSKYALMSVEYQDSASRDSMNLATALAAQDFPETAVGDDLPLVVDDETGETAPAMLPEAQGEPIDYPDFLKEGVDEHEYVHA
ncbi:MAG: recombinase RecT, partial [Oscillibacter sp.]|nr:recombinase RecT [Oscillibacter sp.]